MYRNKYVLTLAIAIMWIVCGGQAVRAEVGSNLLTQTKSDTNEEHFAAANVSTKLNIRSLPGVEGDIVGKIQAFGLMEVKGYENGWCLVNSGEVAGYVSADYLYSPQETEHLIETVGMANLPVAEKVSPVRQQLIDFASQFIGNPYVWGGTSLTNGADCSGYVQSVYREFGVELPRVSAAQANVGNRISVDSAQPGDLIFYEKGGSIYHVVINLGNGQVLNASCAKKGICVSNLDYSHAVWAVDVLG